MYCPVCKRHFESGSKFCPDCEGPNGETIRLASDPAPTAGFTGGSGGLSEICASIFFGLFCTGCVMPFCKPSYFE